jgi:hypothetical protein
MKAAILRSLGVATLVLALIPVGELANYVACDGRADDARFSGGGRGASRAVRFLVPRRGDALALCRFRHCLVDGAPPLLCHTDAACVCADGAGGRDGIARAVALSYPGAVECSVEAAEVAQRCPGARCAERFAP